MPSLAILMTVHNRRQQTLACLQAVFAQQPVSGYHWEIYLTDDGCSDGTPEAIAEKFPSVHIIKGDGNLYWNRGMYKAWEAASKEKDFDFYLWLNDDTYVYPYMLSEVLSISEQSGNQAIIVGSVQASDHSMVTYGGWLNKKGIPAPDGTPISVDYFNGNLVLIPGSIFKKLGNLDYYFSHSKGDYDYGLRAKKSGISIYQTGKILGECDMHESIDKWCDPQYSFRKRWQLLHRPNGMPPKETFHLERKNLGFGKAAFHFCTVYVRCVFPTLWILANKATKG